MDTKLRTYIPVTPQSNFSDVPANYAGVNQITKTLPQVAQLEIKFAGPLIKNSVVEKLDDLINIDIINPSLNYQHRRVWVKEYACEYYLDNGNGTSLENWKRAIGRMVVHTWKQGESYQAGDVVNYRGKLYVATINIIQGVDPTANGNATRPDINEYLWQVITGEIETYRYYFGKVNQVTFYTEIRNPIIKVCLGESLYDENGKPYSNPETGLREFKHIEEVEACIIQGRLNDDGTEIIEEEFPFISNGNLSGNDEFITGGIPYTIRLYTDEITGNQLDYDNKSPLADYELFIEIK